MNENRNLIVAVILCAGVLFAWEAFIGEPQARRQQEIQKVEQARQEAAGGSLTPSAGDLAAPTPAVPTVVTREAALTSGARIKIENASVDGSLLLQGARLDDLHLKAYRETTDPHSPEITLLSPAGAPQAYFAVFGWLPAAGTQAAMPDEKTPWQSSDTRTLTPAHPAVLTWDNGQGLIFTRTISVDEKFMFSISDRVENRGTTAVSLMPYGFVRRDAPVAHKSYFILHEGLLGVFNNELKTSTYKDIAKKQSEPFAPEKPGGWLGLTDKYWMTAIIPDQKETLRAGKFLQSNLAQGPVLQADYLGPARAVEPGAQLEHTQHLFAGAKVVDTIDQYNAALGITRFDLAIDWGWFYFLTRPMFWLLDHYNRLVGNFGIAILLLTVSVKLIFFPLANKSYEAMSKMKKLQPEMVKLRDRYKDDKAKQQTELMELYKKEKVNPVAGCVPMLIQIPVFFSLYKVLFITIEMRHAPFFGWIRDLSAPDPTTIFTLFGLIPWAPPAFLPHIGIWPLIMGVTMFMQSKMNPPAADPMQQRIFMLMPLVFTFMLATFPAGLVIYWAWSNSLSIAQQYVIMRRMGVDMEWDKKFGSVIKLWSNLQSRLGKKKTADVNADTGRG